MRELSWSEPEGWPEDAARDRLIGEWHLWQRKGGHRTSTDDVLTAYVGAKHAPKAVSGEGVAALRYLDLGCGVGSVLLMTAHRVRPAHACGVEAQPQSVLMAQRAVDELPAGSPKVELVHADFRDFMPEGAGARVGLGAGFDLVTGSPPYFPLGTGSLPDDPQRRACRFEARGGVEVYCETAARCLAPDGRFCFVFQTQWDARAMDAIGAAGLHLHARLDAKMRSDRPQPFLTVYTCALQPCAGPPVRESFAIRDAQGQITAAYRAARRELGVESG